MLFNLAIHLVAGVTFALAAVKLHEVEPPARSTGLWTLLPFLVLFVGPVMVVLMQRNPEWFLHYLVEVEKFSWGMVLVQLPVLAVGVGAYLGARKLLLDRPKRRTRVALFFGCFGAAALLLLPGWGRIAVVGTTAALDADSGLRSLPDTTEGYLSAGAVAIIGLGWLITLWRLFLYARAVPVGLQLLGAVPVRDGQTQALPGRGASAAPKKSKKAQA